MLPETTPVLPPSTSRASLTQYNARGSVLGAAVPSALAAEPAMFSVYAPKAVNVPPSQGGPSGTFSLPSPLLMQHFLPQPQATGGMYKVQRASSSTAALLAGGVSTEGSTQGLHTYAQRLQTPEDTPRLYELPVGPAALHCSRTTCSQLGGTTASGNIYCRGERGRAFNVVPGEATKYGAAGSGKRRSQGGIVALVARRAQKAAGREGAPVLQGEPIEACSKVLDTASASNNYNAKEVARVMEENASLRRRVSTLERKLADLQAELEVKDHLLETAKINTNDGHQTERNTPNSAKLSNSSKQSAMGLELMASRLVALMRGGIANLLYPP
ncbi:hypothetical protein Pmar_PMAR020231 [Perkinsus marinus ATCC 50983]|uniref:Uncharacterized protein n=1 Tax=Perkinsus marinus (strain ATCC 50983 / TXsc) TaxID=423536 RepID=C5LTX6_PERM5|nr:hypothetical protein Pmar_PMAR020231 [Perkinsus marinus ATCC 50983]EEQ99774.1 hypothetical protein Pmar_PMAR020231 [Perkinsus marinus ATCC 50983]|eukprot:XP_002767057.1 hypothetical protein Pmar_PMAR020231 [Perkinsus marinus ATCC 50983]